MNSTCRKRKPKIFKIVKVPKPNSKKIGSKKRENEIIQKEKKDSNSSHHHSDNNDMDNDNTEDRNPNSLISISREVLKYLKDNIKSKGANVTQYILTQLKMDQTDKSFKNIQRRVYDAINVMNAAGILEKDKNNLYFKSNVYNSNYKKDKNDKIYYYDLLSSTCSSNNKINSDQSLKETVNLKTQEINRKQHELMTIATKVIKNFIKLIVIFNN
jgi:formaldehyde-activating enzyme involved in methanogenesis